MEVVEERYLGRICGFPLCNNPIEVKNSQRYRIDLRNKKLSGFLVLSTNVLHRKMLLKIETLIFDIHPLTRHEIFAHNFFIPFELFFFFILTFNMSSLSIKSSLGKCVPDLHLSFS